MSKILTHKEAQEIATKMCEALGFNSVTLYFDPDAPESQRSQVVTGTITTTKSVGYLWWKKEVTTTHRDIIASSFGWEDALIKLEAILNGPSGQGRVEKADRLREKHATLLLDEKLGE